MHGGKSLEWGQWEYILGETEDTSEQEVECGIRGVQYFARTGGLRSSRFTSSMRGFMEGEIKSLLPVATWW